MDIVACPLGNELEVSKKTAFVGLGLWKNNFATKVNPPLQITVNQSETIFHLLWFSHKNKETKIVKKITVILSPSKVI